MDITDRPAKVRQGEELKTKAVEEFQTIRLMPTNIPGALTREELMARYSEQSGISIDNFDFYSGITIPVNRQAMD